MEFDEPKGTLAIELDDGGCQLQNNWVDLRTNKATLLLPLASNKKFAVFSRLNYLLKLDHD